MTITTGARNGRLARTPAEQGGPARGQLRQESTRVPGVTISWDPLRPFPDEIGFRVGAGGPEIVSMLMGGSTRFSR